MDSKHLGTFKDNEIYFDGTTFVFDNGTDAWSTSLNEAEVLAEFVLDRTRKSEDLTPNELLLLNARYRAWMKGMIKR